MKHNDRLMTRTEIKNGDGDSISVELNQATRVARRLKSVRIAKMAKREFICVDNSPTICCTHAGAIM